MLFLRRFVADLVLVADLGPLDLPAQGLGELVHELDDPGVFIRGRHPLDVVLELFFQLARTMVALTTWPRMGSGAAVMAHSTTEGCSSKALSTSKGPMR